MLPNVFWVTCPFLIGKVITQLALLPMSLLIRRCPFLIGKVITLQSRNTQEYKKIHCVHS